MAQIKAAARTTASDDFYEINALDYFRDTLGNQVAYLYPLLLDGLDENSLLLDAGSGSGRDTKAFLELGHRLEAFDGSAALAELSSDYTGQSTEALRFEDYQARPARYDGIWAFASLLHLNRQILPRVLRELALSLRTGGTIVASFKVGEHDSIDDFGRRFTNLTDASAQSLFEKTGLLTDVSVTHELGPAAMGRTASWLYVRGRRNTES